MPTRRCSVGVVGAAGVAASIGGAARRLLDEASFTLAEKAVQAEIAVMPTAEQLLPTLTA